MTNSAQQKCKKYDSRAKIFKEYKEVRALQIEEEKRKRIEDYKQELDYKAKRELYHLMEREEVFNQVNDSIYKKKEERILLKNRLNVLKAQKLSEKYQIDPTEKNNIKYKNFLEKAKAADKLRKELFEQYKEKRRIKFDALKTERNLTESSDYDNKLNEIKEKHQVLLSEYAQKLEEIYEKKQKKAAISIENKIIFNRKKAEQCHIKYDKKENIDNNSLCFIKEGIVLSVKNLSMHFGGLKAVDDLSFDVRKGEIFGIIGPNGAGKTTVFNCITQFYKSTAGRIYFKTKEGETICLNDEKVFDVITRGIVRTFQNVEVIKEVSVLDNLLIAAHRQFYSSLLEQVLHLPILKIEEDIIKNRALKVLEFMGIANYANNTTYGLPYGILKKIEIARTLMSDPQLIILDEPAAGLNESETAELVKIIRKIKAHYNCTILLIEHDMGLVMEICDTVCAINFGKLLAIGTPQQIQKDENVVIAYLGVKDE